MRLLTESKSNSKTAKNSAEFISALLHLAPNILSGYNTCPYASAGCIKACLNTAGRGVFTMVQAARIRKTKQLFESRSDFFADLEKDFNTLIRRGIKQNKQVTVRLNGTSDINWEIGTLLTRFPTIQFYDYTKSIKKLHRVKRLSLPNYHVTFSASESNEAQCIEALGLGFNVAVVFRHALPAKYWNHLVIDGDTHDLRFLDPNGPVIVGLTAKGPAKRDLTGFVKD